MNKSLGDVGGRWERIEETWEGFPEEVLLAES